jgi:ABC-type sugar transport system permease subunit
MAKFRYITIPWLKPVLLVVLVLETTWSLKTFDIIWVLTQGGPLDTTMVLNVYAYQQTFQFMKFGYGASIGVLILVLNLLLALAYFRLLRSFEA